MKKAILLPLATAAFALAACSEQAQTETGEAADTIASDINATMGEAVDDVEAAGDRAFGAAENATDRAGAALDRTGDSIENGADRAGAAIRDETRDAREATGQGLRDAGNAID